MVIDNKTKVRLLTRKDVQKIFDISYPTLLKWESDNNWQWFKIKNRIYYKEEFIQEFINSKMNKS